MRSADHAPRTAAIDWVNEWARSPALSELVDAFGGVEHSDELGTWLERLESFSDRWDFRGGRERNLVDATHFRPELTDQILVAAETLGLRGPNRPSHPRYSLVVILGGLVRACLARPRHAANLLSKGAVSADGVVALGGFRPLRGDEVELAARLIADEISDEFEAMDAGVRVAFALGEHVEEQREDSEEVGCGWAIRTYQSPDGLPVRVVAAPSSEPGVRRANTPDTYAWLAGQSGWVAPGDSVLLVTTDIYRPFQHADAIRMLTLPYGIDVDLVGVQPGLVDERLAQTFQAHHYLQEIRSTIRSMRMLQAAAASAADPSDI